MSQGGAAVSSLGSQRKRRKSGSGGKLLPIAPLRENLMGTLRVEEVHASSTLREGRSRGREGRRGAPGRESASHSPL